MATKKTKKKLPSRKEVVIRVSDIEPDMHGRIKTNAKNEGRSQGKEILQFLKEKKVV